MSELFFNPVSINSIHENAQKISKELDLLKVPELWNQNTKGEGVIIAIIDSGCDLNHQDLKENIIGGYNFTEDDTPEIFTDYLGHGTHVAGIVAAADNELGIIGVAPKSKLLILKVIDQTEKGSYKNLIRAINYAINWTGPNNEKVSVINMSLGSTKHSEELYQTIKDAKKKGIVLVSAAGNGGDGLDTTFEISYPGFYKEVIQVGAIDSNCRPTKFSNTNVNIDFVAPGENILSTHLQNKYIELSGTSMAAPFVTGAVALILSMLKETDPIMIPYLVYSYLVVHAQKLGFSNAQEGYGLIQVV